MFIEHIEHNIWLQMFSQHLLNAPLNSLLIVAAVSISGVALLGVLPLDTAGPGDKQV